MKLPSALLAIPAILVAGCSSMAQSQSSAPAPTQVTLKSADRSGDFKPLMFAGTTCNPASGKCKVELKVRLNQRGRCVIKNEADANIAMSAKGATRIVWSLTSSGNTNFQFCPASGDGVFLKDPEDDDSADRQMSDMAVAKNGDGETVDNPTAVKCQKNFRWENKNSGPSADPDDERFFYELRFRDTKSGTVCTFDPWIKNG